MGFNLAIAISICALLFTVTSFWWMNWRKGKLHTGRPSRYSITNGSGCLLIQVPLTFFNDGPTPIIVTDLRLDFVAPDMGGHLKWEAFSTALRSGERTFATPFPVRGREALLQICEFQRRPGGIKFETRPYNMQVMALLNDDREWKPICTFTIQLDEKQLEEISGCLLVYVS
jgi:hypothetical protein